MYKLVLVSALFAINCLHVFGQSQPPIGADAASTLRIVGKLCMPGNHNDDVAQQFFGCYDQAPGKEQFSKCQVMVFGGLLNRKCNIEKTCRPPSRLPMYGACLAMEFKQAGIDMNDAVTRVNICQARVVGVV